MLLSAYVFLTSYAPPTALELCNALSGNLSRCTGYTKPVQAVLRAAAIMRGETVAPIDSFTNGNEGNMITTLSKQAVITMNGAAATGKLSAVVVPISGTTAYSDTQLQVVGKPVRSVDAL